MGIVAFSSAGCSAPYPSDPMEVFMSFSLALVDKDFDSAKNYCTQNYIDNEFNTAQSMLKTMANMSDQNSFQSSIDGDVVKIWASGQESIKVVLVNEKDKWKIDRTESKSEFSEEDAIRMMKGLGGIGDAFGGK